MNKQTKNIIDQIYDLLEKNPNTFLTVLNTDSSDKVTNVTMQFIIRYDKETSIQCEHVFAETDAGIICIHCGINSKDLKR
jgi:hypothetical protein